MKKKKVKLKLKKNKKTAPKAKAKLKARVKVKIKTKVKSKKQVKRVKVKKKIKTKIVAKAKSGASASAKTDSIKSFIAAGKTYFYYSLKSLEKKEALSISRLPVCLRIVLEALLRHFDGKQISREDILNLATWNPKAPKEVEIPFKPARVVAQDFTGVPLLVDLAAMRSCVKGLGKNPGIIEPLVPVDLVVDHSIQVDAYGTSEALKQNIGIEFERNLERYQFLKWGQQAFRKFSVVPPAVGIVHQVNLEYLARGVMTEEVKGKTVAFPDTLVGTDSHTTMINGLGVVGWGVGGIEAEAAMLGQPVYFLTPEVVGVHLSGKVREGVTATDLVLTVTEKLRKTKVVGKFVEFFGEGVRALSLADRATVANMCPEYGATVGFFPSDEKTIQYLKQTGRDAAQVALVETYFKEQGLFGIPGKGDIDYSEVVEISLDSIEPSIAGPKRPQDRIGLNQVKEKFSALLHVPVKEGGFGLAPDQQPTRNGEVGHGSVVIAAITSCTNTSNPSVMLAAGLVAKKAAERGLRVKPYVKTSLAPGSRVVTEYLRDTGLLSFLEQLGFHVVGYGCTTCIGNSGPLKEDVHHAILDKNLIAASVLSGNRNFEARVHADVKASFLMSPPLVVAYALAGSVDIDFSREPIGKDKNGRDVFFKDIWPTQKEITALENTAMKASTFKAVYAKINDQTAEWKELKGPSGDLYHWDQESTYIQEPPFFTNFSKTPKPVQDIQGARILMLLGDSVTTDHISPAGSIEAKSPGGQFLQSKGVKPEDFNSYGSRRGNDRVMTRGTFANKRIKNLMLSGVEGGFTKYLPSGEQLYIYDAAQKYAQSGTPLVVFAGKEYGTGSSRDWAAKGTKLLGIRVVVAESFERIHRSNLIGMGILPLQFKEGENWQSLGLKGDELISIGGIAKGLKPRQILTLQIEESSGKKRSAEVIARIDTLIEVEYYRHGGILDYVLRSLVG